MSEQDPTKSDGKAPSQSSGPDEPVTGDEQAALKEQVRNAIRKQFRRAGAEETADQPSGTPLVGPFRGQPINEILRDNPEVFAIVQEELRKALEEAFKSEADDDTGRKAEYTHTSNVPWEDLETQGPQDLFEPGADGTADGETDPDK